MRIPVNLASEPFRRDRPIIVASAAVTGLLLVSLVMFAYLAWAERQRSAEARQTLAQMTAQMNSVASAQARLEGVLREPQNAEVLERVQFVNVLLLRKGISWTRMFADLEKVIPHNVRLIQVRPQINPNNDVILDMVVGAEASEPVIQLLTNLETSPVFNSVSVHASLPPSQTDPLYRYRVSVQYGQKL
jgi:hypothetical protein